MTQNDDVTERASSLLEQAWLSGVALDGLPDSCRPAEQGQAYRIQQRLVERLGERGGWKVGAPSPDGLAHYSALPARFILDDNSRCRLDDFNHGNLEVELAFLLGRDLPARDTAYTREEVIDAVASVHAVIEIVDSRFRDWPNGADKLSQLADLQNFGRLIVGEGVRQWKALDLPCLPVSLSLDEERVISVNGGNPADDPLALLVWLANDLPAKGQSLYSGDIVTCGSCTGKRSVNKAVRVTGHFEGVGKVKVNLC
ncbi:2-keto-4-pentenoate hydratase [Halomonas sp. DQ26W]|uniref:2-keto-4-pentenoate hydratase n=1 Tax=Halomonas sp. DQ26W TaxID=2282311 RepID=UPI000DF853C4|nr:fumarylacetoacetate hydrolase family protein [Halomonas sp. DQ26W]RDB43056.1 2-keto-4-pentenoate hydratase [Halomonas sp. DQ26W]